MIVGKRVKTESESEEIEGKHNTTSFFLHFFGGSLLPLPKHMATVPPHVVPFSFGQLSCVFSGSSCLPAGLDFPTSPEILKPNWTNRSPKFLDDFPGNILKTPTILGNDVTWTQQKTPKEKKYIYILVDCRNYLQSWSRQVILHNLKLLKVSISKGIERNSRFVGEELPIPIGIQSYSQMMLAVSNHLLSKVFRFHYHSQKVSQDPQGITFEHHIWDANS